MKDLSFARTYVEDFVFISGKVEKKLKDHCMVFGILENGELRLQVVKFIFANDSIELLDHIVFFQGV